MSSFYFILQTGLWFGDKLCRR